MYFYKKHKFVWFETSITHIRDSAPHLHGLASLKNCGRVEVKSRLVLKTFDCHHSHVFFFVGRTFSHGVKGGKNILTVFGHSQASTSDERWFVYIIAISSRMDQLWVECTAAVRRLVVSSKVAVHFSRKGATNLLPLFLTPSVNIRWSKNKHLHWVCFPLVTSSLLKRRPLRDLQPQGDWKHAVSRLYYTALDCFYQRRQLWPQLIGTLLSLFNLRC